jgi:hypothetical protein
VLESLKLGALTMTKPSVQVLGGGPFTKDGPVGLLGFEFLSRLVTEIDFDKSTLRFYAPETYTYSGHGRRLALTTRATLLTVPCEIADARAEVAIDSGSDRGLILYNGFVQQHDLLRKLVPSVPGITGYGFGGPTRAALVRVPDIQFGGLHVASTIVDISMDNAGVETGPVDGNLGIPLLKRFNIAVDVPHGALYLEPNDNSREPQTFDRTGIVLDVRSGGDLRVAWVFPDSPAAHSGISVGDKLTGDRRQRLTEDKWREMSRSRTGTVLRFQIKRKGTWRKVRLVVRDYI